jgi:hypothetical protein
LLSVHSESNREALGRSEDLTEGAVGISRTCPHNPHSIYGSSANTQVTQLRNGRVILGCGDQELHPQPLWVLCKDGGLKKMWCVEAGDPGRGGRQKLSLSCLVSCYFFVKFFLLLKKKEDVREGKGQMSSGLSNSSLK